jgi:hypothetical protein
MGVIIPDSALANLRLYKYSGVDKLVSCQLYQQKIATSLPDTIHP